MKKKKILFCLLLFSSYLISVLLSLPVAYAAGLKRDIVTVKTGVSAFTGARSHASTINKKVFYELGRYWIFYIKWTGTWFTEIAYSTSTDFSSWDYYETAMSGEIQWDLTGLNPAYAFSMYKDGNDVHFSYHPEDDYVRYRKGVLQSDGTLVLGTARAVSPAALGDNYVYTEVALGSDNYPWVAYQPSGLNELWIARCQNADGSGSWDRTEWNQQGDFAAAGVYLHPLPSGKMYSIATNYTGTYKPLEGAIWDTSVSQESNETITDPKCYRLYFDGEYWHTFNVASDVEGDGTNVIHIAYKNNTSYFYKRRDENGVWGAEEDIVTDGTFPNWRGCLTLDHLGGTRISLIYWEMQGGGGAIGNLYRIIRVNGTWGSPELLTSMNNGYYSELQTSMWSETTGEAIIGFHNRMTGYVYGGTVDIPAVARFSASPEIHATFFVNETDLYTTPEILTLSTKNYTFRADDELTYEGDTYAFDFWHVVGVDRDEMYYTASIEITLTSDMNFTIYYAAAEPPPSYPELYSYSTDPTTTLYMRSDTHTINEILGYKLSETQSSTGVSDLRTASGTLNTSYGCRVWIVEQAGDVFELTSGSPVATVTKSDNSSSIVSGTWLCGDRSSYVVNALLVRVYQRFDGTWSLRRNFISHDDMMIRLPSSTWTFYYYINHTQVGGSTYSTFWHGSATYNSRMSFFYLPISPFDTMAYNLAKLDLFAFTFTPWTYHLGDMFWGIILFFVLITTYNRYGSIKPVIAVCWFFGGAGGILSTMIPATALQLSWLLLAFAFAATLFKLMR